MRGPLHLTRVAYVSVAWDSSLEQGYLRVSIAVINTMAKTNFGRKESISTQSLTVHL